jgi:hypothetical protein
MKFVIPVLFALAILLCADDKKRKPSKGPQIELIEATCRRSEGRVLVDGRIRNTSDRPLKNIVLTFRFIAPGRQVIASKNGPLDEQLLEPGDEAEFHLQAPSPARAVSFDVNVEDGSGRELRLDRSGPFPIE